MFKLSCLNVCFSNIDHGRRQTNTCPSQSRLRNIVTLPTEILSGICQLACDDASDFKTCNLENFQLVCRIFRCIAIETLQVWSCVDDSMSLERMELQLYRGGHAGMSLRIALCIPYAFRHRPPPTCKCPQWKLMMDHQSRWTRGFVSLSNLIEAKGHHCLDTLMDMQFPSMTSLSLDCSNSGYEVEQFRWRMPKLESLHCKSDWDVLLPLTAPLKQFTMLVDDDSTIYYEDEWVLCFLAKPPGTSIAAMTIDFSKTGGLDSLEVLRDDVRVELCHLEILHADFGHSDNASEAMKFFGHLDTPNVKMLRVRVNDKIARGEHLWRWLERLTEDARHSLGAVDVVFVDFAVHHSRDGRAFLRRRVLDLFPSHQRVEDAGVGLQSPDMDVNPNSHVLNITFEDNGSAQDEIVSLHS